MPTQPLDYASTHLTRDPWGPILFKLSRRSLLFILLALATAAWLTARHHPWTLTARVPLRQNDGDIFQFFFTPANHLVVDGRATEVWDADRGSCIREIDSSASNHSRVHLTFNHATETLHFNTTDSGIRARLYDIESGSLLKDVLLFDNNRIGCIPVAAAPTGHRMLLRTNPSRWPISSTARDTLSIWDLDAPATQPSQPIATFPIDGNATFSPDGRRIAIFQHKNRFRQALPTSSRPSFDAFGVFDADTATPRFIHRNPQSNPESGVFSPDGRRLIAFYPTGSSVSFDANTGDRDNAWTSPVTSNASTFWSAETQTIAAITVRGRPASQLGLRNVRTGASARRFVAGDPYAYPVFFPNGSLLAAGPEPHTLAIYANPSLRPLALLGERVRDFVQLAVSPDGSHIAVRQLGSILFYRETGPDCPESPLGALGFPHLWLFIALATAAAFSLRYDALRSSSNPTVRIARIALILFLIALPRTLHFLAASCIGENLLTPAPILLLAAIGLATGVRFWRLATLITLAIALPVELYSLHLLHNAGLSQRTPTLLFDRTYSIPNSLAFGLLAMITILIPLALYLLTRRER